MDELATSEEAITEGAEPVTDEGLATLADDEVVDYITDEPVKETEKEKVRQRIARALIHEYGIAVEHMARDFPVAIVTDTGRRQTKRADIAIFSTAAHTLENLRRVIICKPEPKNGRTVTKIRTHEQATKDLDDLKDLMGHESLPQVT
ncbi:MAG: type I restriction enzyme HsdR N-terminal domain-containing protein, partial [Pseudonocardiaceae bacterium]